MSQRYTPGLFDRLIDDQPADVGARNGAWTLEQIKDAVARDLEALLNTRTALPESWLAACPEASGSVLNYGMIDFAAMCMTSTVDQKKICAAVQLAIERHEPRLHTVMVALRVHPAPINRVDFHISATLKADPAPELVYFDAVLAQSTQQYSIRQSASRDGEARA
jgi:type VI secretion system protein ImpF